jgi:hypothetical protein
MIKLLNILSERKLVPTYSFDGVTYKPISFKDYNLVTNFGALGEFSDEDGDIIWASVIWSKDDFGTEGESKEKFLEVFEDSQLIKSMLIFDIRMYISTQMPGSLYLSLKAKKIFPVTVTNGFSKISQDNGQVYLGNI